VERLLATVRKAALPAVAAQGAKLVAEGAVMLESRSATEATCIVRTPGGGDDPSVSLFIEDGEWSCTCDGKVDPCAHVVAAAMAIVKADKTGVALGAKTTVESALVYAFRRVGGELRFERWVQSPSGERRALEGSLTERARGLGVRPNPADMRIDGMVGTRKHGYYPYDRAAALLDALASVDAVEVEGARVKVEREAITPRAVVKDRGDGVVILIEKDPRVTGILVPGIARAGDVIAAVGAPDIGGASFERLPLERRVPRGELGKLVGEILPDLEKRIPVDMRARSLPGSRRRTTPRLLLQLEQGGAADGASARTARLYVTASIVYGDPPEAKVQGGQLVHLGGSVPVRDTAAERSLLLRLRDELNLVPDQRVAFEGADAARFAGRLEAFQASTGGGESLALARPGRLIPRVTLEEGAFDVTFELEEDEPVEGAPKRFADARAVIQAWEEGLPFVPLEGGGFAPLPREFLEKHGSLVADLLDARKLDGSLPKAALVPLADLAAQLDAPPPPTLASLDALLQGAHSAPVLPEDLNASLRPYQSDGIAWLMSLRDAALGGVLADDMGLGKTLQAIAALRGRALVVCPRSVVFNWEAEIRRFRPNLKTALYHGPKRTLDPTADVTLTTYALLRIDEAELAAVKWDAVVLDEAQNIKNPDSQAARAAYAIPAEFRLALSGTPVENRLTDLWSLFRFAVPGLLGSRARFIERVAAPIERGDANAALRLRRLSSPFMLRRRKSDVLKDLPPRTDSVLFCELDERERAVYNAVRAAAQVEVVKKLSEGASPLAALEALLRLRQAACHSGLVPGHEAASSAKVERLVEALEDAAAEGHRALVFSQWTSLLDRVEPALRERDLRFVRLDGSTRDRQAVVDEFQADGGPPVMLISLKAGGTGLNLTAADHVFLLDPWWNPAVEDQAADRAHRIGQDRPVMVYRLVAKDTVEERVLALQDGKRALAAAAVGDGIAAGAAGGITRDEILALLSDG
jgi:superfamily II DNA or RNA helicase